MFKALYSIQCDFCTKMTNDRYRSKKIAEEHTFNGIGTWKKTEEGKHWCGSCVKSRGW